MHMSSPQANRFLSEQFFTKFQYALTRSSRQNLSLTCHIGGEEDSHVRGMHLGWPECEEAEEDCGLAGVCVCGTSAAVPLHRVPGGLATVDLEEVVPTLVGRGQLELFDKDRNAQPAGDMNLPDTVE